MGRLNGILEKLPLIPSKRSLGKRALTRGLSYVKADADVVGHVKDVDSWDLVPADYATDLPQEWREALPRHEQELADEWYVPRDGSRPYPADGVGGSPGTLYGVPIAIGFRNFGHVRRVPNTDIARNVYKGVQTPGVEDEEPDFEPVVTAAEERELRDQREERVKAACEWLVEHGSVGMVAGGAVALAGAAAVPFFLSGLAALAALALVLVLAVSTARSAEVPEEVLEYAPDTDDAPEKVASVVAERTPVKPVQRAVAWAQRKREDADKEKLGLRLTGIGYALLRGEYLTKKGADADSLNLVRDEDGQWAVERVDYSVDEGLFESRETKNPYSAGGIGAEPVPLAGTPIGFSLSKYPQMLAAVTPRLGRNLHEVKLAEGGQSYGGDYFNQNGQTVVADGGHPDMPNPQQVKAGEDDIMLEERAFVTPEDVSLLGGNEDTTEKIKTIEERALASQNMPGDGVGEMIMKYGGLFMAMILGWWMGSQSSGGGGGGSSIESFVPMVSLPDPSFMLDGAFTVMTAGVM